MLHRSDIAEKGAQFKLPYRPSWVDRLMDWVARRPGPAWLYYLGAAISFYAAYLLVKWWEGGIPTGVMSQWPVLVSVVGFYNLAAMHYLDEVARDAMERFHPAFEAPAQHISELDVSELEYRLTNMPAAMVWLMTLVGAFQATLTLVGIASGELSFPGPVAFASVPAALLEIAIVIVNSIFFVVAIYHTVHQLRTVRMIYTELTTVDLFQQGPLHAFARLALFTVISWSILPYFWLTSGLQEAAFGVTLFYLLVIMILGVSTFTWPLLGIHRLLAAEKEQLQSMANKRLQQCLLTFDEAIEKRDLAQMDAINKAIDNAERERRIVDAIPTWPWQTGVLRGVVTAFLLPLILWVAIRILEGLLGP